MSRAGRLLIKIAAAEVADDEPPRKAPVLLPGLLAAGGALALGNPLSRVRDATDAFELAGAKGKTMLENATASHNNLMDYHKPLIEQESALLGRRQLTNPQTWFKGPRAKLDAARVDLIGKLVDREAKSLESLTQLTAQREAAALRRFTQPARLVGGALALGYGGKKLYEGLTAPSQEKTSSYDAAIRLGDYLK